MFGLTLKKIQDANVKRCEDNWHPIDEWSPSDWACAMGGECGEALDQVKKLRRKGMHAHRGKAVSEDRTIVNIGDELADMIHYATLLAARLNIDLEKHVVDKFNLVSKECGVKEQVVMARPWRMAKSLDVLKRQLNSQYPKRSRGSDGGIGDQAHNKRTSDHNPWIVDSEGFGVVSALDITHDPVHGLNGNVLCQQLILDPRVKYVIFNRQIFNLAVANRWRTYRGDNPHTKHVHVSVHPIERLYHNERAWDTVQVIPAVGAGAASGQKAINR